jgi:dienelactone hydrolase
MQKTMRQTIDFDAAGLWPEMSKQRSPHASRRASPKVRDLRRGKPWRHVLWGLAVALALALELCSVAAFAAPSGEMPTGQPTAPWHIAIPSQTVSRDVRFQSGDATLVGTLVAPLEGTKHPTVVVLHDASIPTREYALYRHLTEGLPMLGYAVFVYDRRGSGASSGDLQQSSYTMLADDAVAAARAIAHDPRVDPDRIGYWGLSQGGWLSVLAASRDPKAWFAVSISAPLTTPAEQMNFAVSNLLLLKNYSKADIDQAVRTRILTDDYTRGKTDRETAQTALDAARDKPWFNDIFLQATASAKPAETRWRKVMDYDPLVPLDALNIPVLIMYGDSDPWVPTGASLDRLAQIMPRHRNITVRVIPDADHHMEAPHADDMAYDDASARKSAPQAPSYFLQLGAWLERLKHAS